MTTRKPNVIFVTGAPGAGKGTQCDRIVKNFDYVHLSVGDLLREEVDNPHSDLGREVSDIMKNGSLVPADITCKLIENAMRRSNKANYLIDGFPRDKDNINQWKKSMADKVILQCVLFFDCDEKTSIDRCMKRGKNGERANDNEESLKKRVATYKELTEPIIQYYEKENLVKRIDAKNDVDKIYEDVQTVMKNFQQTK